MVNKEHLRCVIKEINKNKNNPYLMHNEYLADELIKELVYVFPEIKMIKCSIGQWFILSERAEKKVIIMLEHNIERYEQHMKELKEILATLV